jgi:hypothetical protein
MASVVWSLKPLIVFALARRSEGSTRAFAWMMPAARLAEPADAAFDLWTVDVESCERRGGVFAFAPTFALRRASSTKSADAEDYRKMVKTLPSLEMVPRGFLKCDH